MQSKRESLLIAVGAGTNLSLYGIGVWNGSTTLTSGFLFGPAQAFAEWYLWCATLGMFAGIAARALISLLSNASGRIHARTTYGSVIVAAVLFLSGLWTSSLATLCVAAVCTGWSFACLSIFWVVRIYRAFDQARYLFPLMLLCSAFINAAFAFTPQGQLHIYLGLALIATTLCSALIRNATPSNGAAPTHPALAAELRTRYVPAFKSFAGVLFCVAALEVIAPTMNYMGLANTLEPGVQLGVVCAAQTSAAVILFFVLKLQKAPLHSVQFFKFVTPVLILALFPVPFAGYSYSLAMLLIGSCLHFVVVSSLFCVDAIAIARRSRLTFEFFYATGLFALMVACVALEEIMPMILQTSSSTDLLVVFGVFFCIYILSMAFMFARRQRQDPADKQQQTVAAPHEDTSSPSKPALCSRIVQREHQLSERETEILELLLRGKNVPAIAEELIISQNTVRSHVKRIYRATNIHTRQELISYCEGIDTAE